MGTTIIHDIDALDLQEKIFFPPFFMQLMFIHEMRQTWILIIIYIFFIMGTTIMFSIRIHDIDALNLEEKLFFPPFSL